MSIFEIALLLLVLIAGLLILFGTLQTGISPMMSSVKARKAMLESIDAGGHQIDGELIDLGSAWGTLVVDLARKYPDKQVIGYELSWLPWAVSVLRLRLLRLNNATIYRQDFLKADLGKASILSCYLFKEVMSALEDKLKREQVKQLTVVSNSFALPNVKPAAVTRIDDLYKSPIYRYYWP